MVFPEPQTRSISHSNQGMEEEQCVMGDGYPGTLVRKIAFCFDIPVVPFTPIDAVYHPIHKEFGYLGKHQHYLANMICSLI